MRRTSRFTTQRVIKAKVLKAFFLYFSRAGLKSEVSRGYVIGEVIFLGDERMRLKQGTQLGGYAFYFRVVTVVDRRLFKKEIHLLFKVFLLSFRLQSLYVLRYPSLRYPT